jgi:hypothetical protein
VEKHLGFDIAANDKMARRFGSDFVEQFAKGMRREQSRLGQRSEAAQQHLAAAPRPQSTGGGGGGGGGTTITVVLERGAVQVNGRGGGGGQVDGSEIADEVAQEFDDRTSGLGRL